MQNTLILVVVFITSQFIAQSQPKKITIKMQNNIKCLAANVFNGKRIEFSKGNKIIFDAKCSQEVITKEVVVLFSESYHTFVWAFDGGCEFNGLKRISDHTPELLFYIFNGEYYVYQYGDYSFAFEMLARLNMEDSVENICEVLKKFIKQSWEYHTIEICDSKKIGEEIELRCSYFNKEKFLQNKYLTVNFAKRTIIEKH